MAKATKYTANTAMVTISTANPNLDGSGTLGTLLTGADNGTLVKTITVKAAGNTSGGMVRIFANNGANNRIIAEIEVPAITCSATVKAFEQTVDVDYFVQTGGILKTSTEIGDSFNVIAEGLNFAYYGSERPECTKYTANTGFATLTTGNTALDGSGTLGTNIWNVLTAASNGTIIQSVIVKAQVSTTPGVVRLFLHDGANTKLLEEILVPAIMKSATSNSFSARIEFSGRDFVLKSGWSLRATTHNSESFNVIAEGLNWEYPA